MAKITTSFWIPRSYTHLIEMEDKLENSTLDVSEISMDDVLSFKIRSPEARVFSVTQTPSGLFSFEQDGLEDMKIDAVLEQEKRVKELLVDVIFKSLQPVSYQQLKKKVLPIAFHSIVSDTDFAPPDYVSQQSGEVRISYDSKKWFYASRPIYVQGPVDSKAAECLKDYSYICLVSRYVSWMVEMMAEEYKDLNRVNKRLDENGFSILRQTLLSTEKIKTECSERYGKLIQAHENYRSMSHQMKSRVQGDAQNDISKSLQLDKGFSRLEMDFNYLVPLWKDVLLMHLENLSFTVNARIELQESIETRREEREMKLMQAIYMVGVISSIIALGAMPGANLSLYSPSGDLLASGQISAFNMEDLLSWGVIAVVFSLGLFFLFNFLYEKVSSRRRNI